MTSNQSRQDDSSINSFPPEVLRIIFTHAYMNSLVEKDAPRFCFHEDQPELEECPECLAEPLETEWCPTDDPKDPTYFPYSISRVSTYWDSVMSPIPLFWTRIVAWIDTDNVVETLQRELERSRPLELHSLTITRKVPNSSDAEPQEYEKAAAIAKFLSGHISRCKTFTFEVLHYETLFHLLSSFPFTEPFDAKTLTLSSSWRGPFKHDIPQSLTSLSHNHHLSIGTLNLTGSAFAAVYHNKHWREALSRTDIHFLEISHLRPEDGGDDPLTTAHLIDMFTYLPLRVRSLTLRDVDLPQGPPFHSVPISEATPFTPSNLNSAKFQDLPAYVIDSLYALRYLDVESLTFDNCALDGCTHRLPPSYSMTLLNIPDRQSLSTAFQLGNTCQLFIKNCPGLDDAALEILCQGTSVRPVGCMRRLHALYISDSPNFAISSLKRVVEHRRANADGTDLPIDDPHSDALEWDCAPILDLGLSGAVPSMTTPEDEWFRSHIPLFDYRPAIDQ